MLGEALDERLGAHIQHAGLAVHGIAVRADGAVDLNQRTLVIRAVLGDPVLLDVLVAILAVVLEHDERNVRVGHLNGPWKNSPEWIGSEWIHCISCSRQMAKEYATP